MKLVIISFACKGISYEVIIINIIIYIYLSIINIKIMYMQHAVQCMNEF